MNVNNLNSTTFNEMIFIISEKRDMGGPGLVKGNKGTGGVHPSAAGPQGLPINTINGASWKFKEP